MSDIVSELDLVHRNVGSRQIAAGPARTIVLERHYPAPVEEVWDAITDPERISRWMRPVTGDLRLGGHYQLEDNAHGEIVGCQPPHQLAVTWIYGDAPASEVRLRLTGTEGGGTALALEHAAVADPEQWSRYGPGAAGVGWDLTLLGLSLHLRGQHIEDPERWGQSPQAREFMAGSSQAWGRAYAETGADPEEVAAAVANTTGFYAPEPAA